jgi:hypothetical protein
MNKKLLTGALLMLAFGTKAQTADRQVIGTAGGSFSSGSLAADHTLGETIIETKSTGSFLLTQGFQQPVANTTAIPDADKPGVVYSLYPNPAGDKITLELSSQVPARLLLSVVAVNGQLVQATEPLQLNGSIKKEYSVAGLTPGTYFLQLANTDGVLLQSIRFVKQ